MNKKRIVARETQKYYSLDRILSKNACYNIIFGERSNGKTYSVLKYALPQLGGGKRILLADEQVTFSLLLIKIEQSKNTPKVNLLESITMQENFTPAFMMILGKPFSMIPMLSDIALHYQTRNITSQFPILELKRFSLTNFLLIKYIWLTSLSCL